jgi:hypothetical protein
VRLRLDSYCELTVSATDSASNVFIMLHIPTFPRYQRSTYALDWRALSCAGFQVLPRLIALCGAAANPGHLELRSTSHSHRRHTEIGNSLNLEKLTLCWHHRSHSGSLRSAGGPARALQNFTLLMRALDHRREEGDRNNADYFVVAQHFLSTTHSSSSSISSYPNPVDSYD